MNREKEVAKMLLETKAVTLNLSKPFQYDSGILSPIYTDNRILMSYPEKREKVRDYFREIIDSKNLEIDLVAGVATAGIAHAAWLADALGKPMAYVRGKVKDHGKQNQVEGIVEKGMKAIVIEDLVSTGNSTVQSAIALQELGAEVLQCVAIFTYEMQKAKENFQNANLPLETLTNFTALMEVAQEMEYVTEEEKKIALEWNKDPESWGKRFEGNEK